MSYNEAHINENLRCLMYKPNHSHQDIEDFIVACMPDHIPLPLLLACDLGCIECLNLFFIYGSDPYHAYQCVKRYYSVSSRKECIERIKTYIEQNAIMQLLVGIRQDNPGPLSTITRHPLYTRDVLRSILKLVAHTASSSIHQHKP